MAKAPTQRILIVDDEADILEVLGDFLEANVGVAVSKALSGGEALTVLEKTSVDLIISDYKMPGMDGLEFLRQAALRLPAVPRVLMTAYPDMDLAINSINEGRILHFFSKPLAPEELVGVVRAILDERRARAQREAALQRSLEHLRTRGTSA